MNTAEQHLEASAPAGGEGRGLENVRSDMLMFLLSQLLIHLCALPSDAGPGASLGRFLLCPKTPLQAPARREGRNRRKDSPRVRRTPTSGMQGISVDEASSESETLP